MSSLCQEILYMTRKGEGDMARFSDLGLTSYARTEMSGKRRSEGVTSVPDRVEATIGDNVHGNSGDGRQHADGKRSAVPGGKAVTAPVTTGEEGDKPSLCDQQEGGGDGGLRGGVSQTIQCGPDEVRGGGADDRHEVETEGNHVADGDEAEQLPEATFKGLSLIHI